MGWEQRARRAARAEGVDGDLYVALVRQESGGRMVTSGAGAIGPAQLMPGTARGLGVDPYDFDANLRGGARYLRQQLDAFGTVKKALAAYNAGPGAVTKYGGVPPFSETQNYVRTIMASYRGPGVTSSSGGGGGGNAPSPTSADSGGADMGSLARDLVGGRIDMLDFAVAAKGARDSDLGAADHVNVDGNSDTSRGGRMSNLLSISSLVQQAGLAAPSGMRTTSQNAAVGGATHSDHLSDDAQPSWARDFGGSDRSRQRRGAQIIARKLGVRLTGSFTQAETTIGGRRARVQIIYGSENRHGDHLHWGIRWLE